MSHAMPADRAVVRIPLSAIDPNPGQPRREFPPESIRALSESIRLHGLLSPLLVRRAPGGRCQLIAGERRLRALRALGRAWAEAIVLPADDCDSALMALVENLHREDLHYLDVAAACRRILDSYPITQERLAASLSCSPSALNNRLRLLRLDERVQSELRLRGLGERHARALLKLQSPEEQLAMIALAAEKCMSASQLERCVERRPAQTSPKPISGQLRI